MNWKELSRSVSREVGCDTDFVFSKDVQHPCIVSAIRIATLREREACANICDNEHGTAGDAADKIRMRNNQ